MSMTKEQITNAYNRAAPVVNGFTKVRDQQARDVVATVAERDAEIDRLKKKVLGLELQAVGATRAASPFKF